MTDVTDVNTKGPKAGEFALTSWLDVGPAVCPIT